MKKIVYDEQTILNAQKNVNMCNDNILEALKNIENELLNLDKTVNTPKMNKSLPTMCAYINKKVNYVSNSRESFNRKFNIINNEYHDYLLDINRMVGGNND